MSSKEVERSDAETTAKLQELRAQAMEKRYTFDVQDALNNLLEALAPGTTLEWGVLKYPELVGRAASMLAQEYQAVTGHPVLAMAIGEKVMGAVDAAVGAVPKFELAPGTTSCIECGAVENTPRNAFSREFMLAHTGHNIQMCLAAEAAVTEVTSNEGSDVSAAEAPALDLSADEEEPGALSIEPD